MKQLPGKQEKEKEQQQQQQQQQQTSSGGNRLRRKYDRDFKQEAVKMLKSGRSYKEVSQLLGVSEQALYNWRSLEQGRTDGQSDEEFKAVRQEAEVLRKRLKEVEMERDILKKALHIFSRTTS